MDFRAIGKRIAMVFVMIALAPGVWAQSVYKIHVDGLSCPFCAYGLEKKLGAIKGVQRTEVDIASGTVRVTMAEDATLDEGTAKKAVKEAGFSLRSLEQAQSASQNTPPSGSK